MRNLRSALTDRPLLLLAPHQHEPLEDNNTWMDIDQRQGKHENMDKEYTDLSVLCKTGSKIHIFYVMFLSPHLLLIMFTSLAPSPMDIVIELVCFLTSVTISAFWPGVTRQHRTDWQCSATLMNAAPHSGLWLNSACVQQENSKC